MGSEYVKLANPHTVLWPVIEGNIRISSEEIDDINRYHQFLLLLIGRGKDIEYISDIVGFGREQIVKEIEYMIKYGMVEASDSEGQYELTELGRDRVRLIGEINEFNAGHYKVFVDQVTGGVSGCDEEPVEDGEDIEDLPVLVPRIIREPYGNLNPVNSKQYFTETYHLESVKDEEIESIDVELKLDRGLKIKRVVNYGPKLIAGSVVGYLNKNFNDEVYEDNAESSHSSESQEDDSSSDDLGILPIFAVGRVYPVKLQIRISGFDKYRHAYDTLLSLRGLDPELLTHKADEIIKALDTEMAMNRHLKTVYVDTISGNIYKNFDREDIRRRPQIEIPEQYEIKDLAPSVFEEAVENILKDEFGSMEYDFDVLYEAGEPFTVIKEVNAGSLLYGEESICL